MEMEKLHAHQHQSPRSSEDLSDVFVDLPRQSRDNPWASAEFLAAAEQQNHSRHTQSENGLARLHGERRGGFPSGAWFAWVILSIILLFSVLREIQWQQTECASSIYPFSTTGVSALEHADEPNTERLAYITLFTETAKEEEGGDYTYDEDWFFIAARMLTYQLVHMNETRSRRSIPFIIMVTPDVSRDKQDRLTKDGAIVMPVEYVQDGQDWMNPGLAKWKWMLTKFRAWELTDYTRMAFVDSDFILQRSLDGVFDAANTTIVPTLNNATMVKDDEAPLPSKYLLASMPEVKVEHKYPPDSEDFSSNNRINAGFLIFAPSRVLFEYYTSVARLPYRFWPAFMEQSLLNYAHRSDGNMPHKQLPTTFNLVNPTRDDVAGGVASFHYKWWEVPNGYPELSKYFLAVRWRMEAFYEMQDNLQKHEHSNETVGR